MAKTARAAIEDLLTCESCHAFYYVERAEDGARTRLRCTSCGHSRDVLLSGAKTNKWTVIDPNGEVKTFTEWDEVVRSMAGSVVTAVRAKLPSDEPISHRAMSEAPPAAAPEPVATRAASERPAPRPASERPAAATAGAMDAVTTEQRSPSNRPGSNRPGSNRPGSNRPAPEVPPLHEVQPIGPSVTPNDLATNGANGAAASATEEEDKPRPSLSGAALLDVTPNPIAPALSLDDSIPGVADKESDKSIDIAMSEPNLPAVPESKPEALVEALVSSMPEATTAAPPVVEKTADVAPVEAKEGKQEPWDDDEAEVLSMRDIQVVPVTDRDSQREVVIRDSQTGEAARNSSTPPPPARGTLRTLPPARFDAPPPPTITFDDPKKSDPPPAVKKSESSPPAKTADKAKSDAPKKDAKDTKDASESKDKNGKKSEGPTKEKESRTAATLPPKRGETSKPGTATAKAQVAPPEEGGRSWLLPAIGVAAAAGVVWYLASGSNQPTQPTTNPTPTTTTTAAPENTTASTAKTPEPQATTTTTTATATTSASATPPTEKAATPTVKPADTTTANNGTTATPAATGEKKPTNNANLSMSEALDKAGQAKRSGDYANAKDLYARVLKDSPSNVEAHSGLGDIARAQGDLAAAKASYQKALAASPDYGPALLSLADTEWDMGDRAAAQARYAKIVAARGGSAPARAKERAGTE